MKSHITVGNEKNDYKSENMINLNKAYNNELKKL